MLLFFSPLFIDGFCQFDECLLQILEVVVVVGEHIGEVPFQLSFVAVEVVFVHVLGALLVLLLGLLVGCWSVMLMGGWLLVLMVVVGWLGVIVRRVLVIGLVRIFRIVLVMLRLHPTIQNISF